MIWIGIDPGLEGAIAFLGVPPVVGSPAAVFDTPRLVLSRRPYRRAYDPRGLATLIRIPGSCESRAVIERVHAMPGQGVRSMFTLGYGLGIWEGILAALGVPYELVTPQRWQRGMLDGTIKGKEAARLCAIRLFPALRARLMRRRDHNRAEALLLAEWLRRTSCGA